MKTKVTKKDIENGVELIRRNKAIENIVQVIDLHQREQAKREILHLIDQEKKKWKAEMMSAIGEDEENLHDPWTDERYAEDARNKFRQQLREKVRGI